MGRVGALFEVKVATKHDTDAKSKWGRRTDDRSASLCQKHTHSIRQSR